MANCSPTHCWVSSYLHVMTSYHLYLYIQIELLTKVRLWKLNVNVNNRNNIQRLISHVLKHYCQSFSIYFCIYCVDLAFLQFTLITDYHSYSKSMWYYVNASPFSNHHLFEEYNVNVKPPFNTQTYTNFLLKCSAQSVFDNLKFPRYCKLFVVCLY
jgi:hypothetical protein